MKNTEKLFTESLDAAVVISDKNRLYFTGFASTYGFLVLFKDKNIFITDPRYFEMAQSLEQDGVELRLVENGKSAYGLIADILKENGAVNVGYEDTELTVKDYSALSESLKDFSLKPCGDKINEIRRTKDESEISFIKKAQSITDAAFTDILSFIKAGMSEKDVCVELEYRMAKHGAEGLAFDTIVASGINSSKPHAHPTDKIIASGDAVTMDFGARYAGYCSDMTRTVFVGEPSEEMRNIYNIVLLAQKTAINNAYCGMTGKELDLFAREVIAANGHAAHFTHSTGHSLGIDIHEEPRASMYSEEKLTANQFITVEPGIYVPGLGGVRIEDLLLIKEDEVIDLTTSDKNIIIL